MTLLQVEITADIILLKMANTGVKNRLSQWYSMLTGGSAPEAPPPAPTPQEPKSQRGGVPRVASLSRKGSNAAGGMASATSPRGQGVRSPPVSERQSNAAIKRSGSKGNLKSPRAPPAEPVAPVPPQTYQYHSRNHARTPSTDSSSRPSSAFMLRLSESFDFIGHSMTKSVSSLFTPRVDRTREVVQRDLSAPPPDRAEIQLAKWDTQLQKFRMCVCQYWCPVVCLLTGGCNDISDIILAGRKDWNSQSEYCPHRNSSFYLGCFLGIRHECSLVCRHLLSPRRFPAHSTDNRV